MGQEQAMEINSTCQAGTLLRQDGDHLQEAHVGPRARELFTLPASLLSPTTLYLAARYGILDGSALTRYGTGRSLRGNTAQGRYRQQTAGRSSGRSRYANSSRRTKKTRHATRKAASESSRWTLSTFIDALGVAGVENARFSESPI